MSDDCVVFFFFSSRRRHTRCSRDWSSDVCSSDLAAYVTGSQGLTSYSTAEITRVTPSAKRAPTPTPISASRNPVFATMPKTSADRSEEHTSELQSRLHLVCRLLLEKKKITYTSFHTTRL